MPRVLIFAGAPEADWSSPDLLPEPGSTNTSATEWRSLPLHRAPLVTGYSQHHGLPSNLRPPAHFFNISLDADSQQTASQSQFYDHSLALHHNLASSQLPSQSGMPSTGAADSFDVTDSFMTTAADSFQDTTISSVRPPPVTSYHLSDLEDVPSGPELVRLEPQTVTVNLIVGVISVSDPRTVETRWGTELRLVEVLVGDETRAGFSVTFWLPKDAKSVAGSNTILPTELRRQDVVLMQNVALHVFRGKVYGQSLRKGLTKTTVMYRRKMEEGDEGGIYRRKHLESRGDGGAMSLEPQLAKTRRVWDWVLKFVGGEQRPETKGKKRRGWDLPPDDTQ